MSNYNDEQQTNLSGRVCSLSTVEGPESAQDVAANLTGASVSGDGMLSWAGPGVLVSASMEYLGAAGALPGSAARTPSYRGCPVAQNIKGDNPPARLLKTANLADCSTDPRNNPRVAGRLIQTGN
ncbi:hypothetical protein AAFF_G00054890 [Aldrovandia affinis]|uniref:Uncharacterized protein n=1 Tax=Aldrovandia affinis TaxID=143900 RepID=A0AAD7WEB3_9TELE|nr:hypothetical protein AAFF_G00054890 [Aldrovandia affinis]